MSFNDDPKIDRIRKLLKQAESAAKIGNQAEADAYNERAAKLIAKYGVDQALLADSGKISDAVINKRIEVSGDYVLDKRLLLTQIIRALGAKGVYLSSRRPGTRQSYSHSVHIFAHESDMNRIEFLFELVLPQMLLGAAVAEVPYWENPRSFRKSWMNGFSTAIRQRLQRNEKQAATDAGTGTDLVLFNRSTAVEQSYTLAYPKLKDAIPRNLKGSGRSQGYAAGTRANIGNEVDNGSHRVLVG